MGRRRMAESVFHPKHLAGCQAQSFFERRVPQRCPCKGAPATGAPARGREKKHRRGRGRTNLLIRTTPFDFPRVAPRHAMSRCRVGSNVRCLSHGWDWSWPRPGQISPLGISQRVRRSQCVIFAVFHFEGHDGDPGGLLQASQATPRPQL